jgi:bifunctional UDP-N-acetylglucosamine pyrophosphorylase/glucosamine-1-phosphate N-acetyltransferase
MKAVILAAGEGVRMRPLTYTTPKPLLEVHGKPLIERLVETFPSSIDELIIVVGYKGDMVKAHCGRKFCGRPVSYATQEQAQGTYHALTLAKPYLDNRPFALFFADDLYDSETIADLVQYPLAVVTSRAKNPSAFGVVELTSSGHIRSIIEKPEQPTSNMVLTSAYALTRDIFDHGPEQKPNGEYYLSEALASMAKTHPVKAVPAKFWFPIATPEDLETAHHVVSV